MSKPFDTKTESGARPGNFGPRSGGPMMMGPVVKPKNFKQGLRRLLSLLKPHQTAMLVVLALSIVGTACSIIGPKILGQATTLLFEGLIQKFKGQGEVNFSSIGLVLLSVIALYLVSAVLNGIMQWVMAGIAQKTVRTMRSDISDKLQRLPLRFFDSRPHGDILSRITNDIDTIGTTLQQALGQIISSLITIIGVLVMMLLINPWLTLIGILALPISFGITGIIASKSRAHFGKQQAALGAIAAQVEEMANGHRILKAFDRVEYARQQFQTHNKTLWQSGWRAQFLSGLIMPFMNFINNLGYVAVAVAGGIMVAAQTIAIGDIQAFIQYLRMFSMPLVQTAQMANIFQSTIAAAERVFEILDAEEDPADCTQAIQITKSQGNVAFHHVNFRYKVDQPLIDNLSINVKSGQVVAIVGPTGAGKTTLVNLLLRFYELDAGTITIDGVDLQSMRRTDLRSCFGMVLQDTWLFAGSIHDNIAYAKPNASRAEVVQAAKAAHADHFIRTLAQGYDTVLSEDASGLSQGQRQLMAIARAVLADPAILILDEATSNVDTRTEGYIQNAMLQLMHTRTSFVIAHRLSTIQKADVILVMKSGQLVEQGNHQSLLAQGGFYSELYQSQFALAE